MAPAPWDQGCGSVTEKGGQGQNCFFGFLLSPSWDRIRNWKGCVAPALLHAWCRWELQRRCFTALGHTWHLLLLLPQMSHMAPSPAAPAPARSPPCPLPAVPLWLSACGSGISLLPFAGMGWETQNVPWPVLDPLMTSQGLRCSNSDPGIPTGVWASQSGVWDPQARGWDSWTLVAP